MFKKEAEEICSKYFEENCRKKNKWADTHDLVAMWQDGYNKANEWHYVKDGDLPKMNTELLFYCYGSVKQGSFVGFFKSYYGDHRTEDVIAWKEIVLPKESE